MLKKKDNGTVNPSYEVTEDETVVTLRSKINQNGLSFSNGNCSERKSDAKHVDNSHKCFHKNVQKVSMFSNLNRLIHSHVLQAGKPV